MEQPDEEVSNQDACVPNDESSHFPSSWLAFYSCTLLLGGAYLANLVWFETTQFPIRTGALAFVTFTTGVLLWFRKHIALWMYVAIAIGFIVYSVYRVATEGYASGRLGIGIGGFLMLVGYSSVAEELPGKSHREPMERSGRSTIP
jgi:hypothetical protein